MGIDPKPNLYLESVQSPLRVVSLLRPNVRIAIVVAVVVTTFVFTATPFLIDLVADEYGYGLTITSLVSTGQLLGFAVGSFGAGRRLHPTKSLFVAASTLLVVANTFSALVPPFAVLVALRVAAGLGMGIVSWLGWSLVMGHTRRTAEMSMLGPLAGIIASPLIAPLAEIGIGQVYGFLAALALAQAAAPIILPQTLDKLPDFNPNANGAANGSAPATKSSAPAARQAVIILAALGVFTAGGSSVFVFTALIGADLGVSLGAISIAYSVNSIAGVIGARWPFNRGPAGAGIIATGIVAVLTISLGSKLLLLAGIITWGLFFWIGMPAALNLLAERSRFPEERAGDAQAIMAFGRVVGPFVGGALLDLGGPGPLGIIGGAAIIGAGLTILGVSRAPNPIG